MSAKKRGKERLAELEARIKDEGVVLAYEKLSFAGLRLKSGLCWFKGRYYLFVDKAKPLSERLELLESALEELVRLQAEGGHPVEPEEPAGGEAGEGGGGA